MSLINLKLGKKLFNDAYLPYLFDYSKRYSIFFGGAGSGKSVFIGQKLVTKACKYVRKVLVIRKYGTTLKDSVFQLIVDQLKKWDLYQFCTVNLSTYTITLPNGSMFLFKGLDDSEKIKSITDITDIWVEEATEIINKDFTMSDIKEGELSVSYLWFELYRRLYAKENTKQYSVEDISLCEAADKKYPLPKRLDFRMH